MDLTVKTRWSREAILAAGVVGGAEEDILMTLEGGDLGRPVRGIAREIIKMPLYRMNEDTYLPPCLLMTVMCST